MKYCITMVIILLVPLMLAACPRGVEPVAGTDPAAGQPATTTPPVNTTSTSQNQPTTGTPVNTAGGTPAVDLAPDFNFTGFDGKRGKLSDFRGQPVVLNFWAAWCPPCRGEMPLFEEAYRAKAGQFVMLAVAVDTQNNPKSFFDSQEFSFLGAQDIDGAAKYLGRAIPVTVFIDREGRIVSKQEGSFPSRAEFDPQLAAILK